MSYIKNLIIDCQKALKAEPLKEIVLKEPYDLSVLLKGSKAIYVFELIDGDAAEVFEGMREFKALQSRKCPRLNAPSQTLYVGSSATNLKNRLEQHLGEGYRETYAMHLGHWFKGKFQIRVRFMMSHTLSYSL